VARVGHAGRREPFALLQLRGREHGRRGIDRVRQHEPLRDPGADRDRPVDPRRDQAVNPLGGRQPVDLRLVLDRDDRPPVGEGEARRGRIPVGRDHIELMRAGGLEQSELPGARA
jgi:hypothetical protein